MPIALLHLFIASANVSFLLGLWLANASRKNRLLIAAFLGAALIFTAAYLEQLPPPQPVPPSLYKAIPATVGLLYAAAGLHYTRRSFLQPNYRDRAVFAGLIAVFHFAVSAAAYLLPWPLKL